MVSVVACVCVGDVYDDTGEVYRYTIAVFDLGDSDAGRHIGASIVFVFTRVLRQSRVGFFFGQLLLEC